jgi:hypothetical protein
MDDGSRYTNAVYFFIFIVARRIVLFGAGRYENGYASPDFGETVPGEPSATRRAED